MNKTLKIFAVVGVFAAVITAMGVIAARLRFEKEAYRYLDDEFDDYEDDITNLDVEDLD